MRLLASDKVFYIVYLPTMTWIKSSGVLRASFQEGLLHIALDVDPEIVDRARTLVPKYVRLARQRYAPHIRVVREPTPLPGWQACDKLTLPFFYSPEICPSNTYFWLRAESLELRQLRLSLGLPEMDWYTYPPDLDDCFYITVGNTKAVSEPE